MKTYLTSNKAVFLLNYHIIFCPKYRRKVLIGNIKIRCEELIKQVCIENNWEIIALEIMPEHVHLAISTNPINSPHKIVKAIKGKTSNILRKEFPELVSKLPSLWTRSYFISTVGNASTETVKKYIEDQWKK